MLEQLSKNLKPRLMLMLLSAVVVLILSSSYAIWFKAPLSKYRELQQQYLYLQQRPFNQKSNADMLDKIRHEINAIDSQLAKKTQREALKKTRPLAVIADLGHFAKQYNVQMVRVTPADPVPGKVYTETPFKVELIGNYQQLFKWVYSLEHSGLPLLIKDFSLVAGEVEGNRQMSLNLGLIQLSEEG